LKFEVLPPPDEAVDKRNRVPTLGVHKAGGGAFPPQPSLLLVSTGTPDAIGTILLTLFVPTLMTLTAVLTHAKLPDKAGQLVS